jgi:hypothetical protein
MIVAAFLLVAASAPSQRVETLAPASALAPVVIQLDGVPTSSLVTMLLRDVMKVPYVIAPDVLSDRRPTSVRLVIPRSKIPESVVGYLRRSGFTVELQGGAVYVGRKGSGFGSVASPGFGFGQDAPFGSPLASPVRGYPSIVPASPGQPGELPVGETGGGAVRGASAGDSRILYSGAGAAPLPLSLPLAVYVPAHRDPAYLASVVGAVLPGLKFGARSEAQADAGNQTIREQFGPDVLVLTGSPEDLEKARRLCAMLDRPRPLVAVRAVVVQVSNVQTRGSALSLLASVGGGRVSAGSFSDVAPAAQFVRIGAGAIRAVLSAVREDTRFRVVAAPNLTALSGGVATMNSGSQVPTLGAVVAGDNGPPVQSIAYRDSGITLTVRPVVRGDLIELAVSQERSTFVRTATGVTDSPTLQKVSAQASVALRSGESVALAGLTETSNGNTRKGLFGGLLGVRQRDASDAELVVLITAELVPLPKVAAGVFTVLSDPAATEDENGDTVDPLAPLPVRAGVAVATRGH